MYQTTQTLNETDDYFNKSEVAGHIAYEVEFQIIKLAK